MADIAKKAAAIEGADFVALILDGGDPNGANKSVEELIGVVKEVADAVDCPLVVEGCKNVEKDAELLPKVAEALQGRNALILSEKEENYKAIGAAAGLAYNQHSEFRRPFPLLALLPSGHGERAVARVAGKAPAAARLSQTAASDALSPKANSSSVCLRRLKFYMPQPSVPNGGGS